MKKHGIPRLDVYANSRSVPSKEDFIEQMVHQVLERIERGEGKPGSTI